jgi:hypothetical protein
MDSILSNGTCELLERPHGCRHVGYKWVFKKKLRPNGTIDCSPSMASSIVFSIDMRPKFINYMVITIILLSILSSPLLLYI